MAIYESLEELKVKERWLDVISYGTTDEYPETRGWRAWEGIREVIQNSLDETQELTDIPTYKSVVTSEGIEISDKGRGIGVRNLLIGSSEKPVWARGKFGEGLKIGFMTLLSLGYDIEMYSGNYYIKPMFVVMKFKTIEPPYYFTEKVFVIAYRAIEPPVEGTIVKIKGLFDDYRERLAINLTEYAIFYKPTSVAGKTFYYHILDLGPGRRKIFVKDIYVCDANEIVSGGAIYSYNLVNVVLDESRRIPSSSRVFSDLGELYAACDTFYCWYEVLKLLKSEEDKLESHIELRYIRETEVQKVVKEAWDLIYGPLAVVMTDSSLREFTKWLGYEPIKLPYYFQGVFKEFLDTDTEKIREFHTAERGKVPEEKYSPQETDRIEVAKLIAEELSVIYKVPTSSVEVWELPPGVEGEHHPDANRIVISKEMVDGPLYKFLEITMHELTHRYTGAEDGTTKMIRELGKLAGHVNELLITKPELVTRIRVMVGK